MAMGAGAMLGVAMLGYGGYVLTRTSVPALSQTASSQPAPSSVTKAADATPAKSSAGTASGGWVAAAPGRVEPRNGEIKIGTPILGRVIEVLAVVGDRVEEGELLVKLDDDEARARMAAAEYEAGARRQERDRLPATAGREDVRRAEDAVYAAERGVTGARFELDFAQAARRKSPSGQQTVDQARKRLDEANERLQRERLAFATAQAKSGLPSPSRAESMVSAGRAEVAIAEAILDKTRIRAPIQGTVLTQNAKLGEIIGPSPEQPLIIMGDVQSMRVKAEADEADVAKIRIGQRAFVRSQSFPGNEFEGVVTKIAPTLAPPRIGQRGPRRATDVEVIEVTIDLLGKVPLLTGMRVDAFFRK